MKHGILKEEISGVAKEAGIEEELLDAAVRFQFAYAIESMVAGEGRLMLIKNLGTFRKRKDSKRWKTSIRWKKEVDQKSLSLSGTTVSGESVTGNTDCGTAAI